MLESIDNVGDGGAGMQGDGPGTVAAAIKELQGLNVTLLAGALADTKIDVAAIRSEDTILTCLNNAAGTITDVTDTMSINTLFATGTLTLSTAIAGSTAEVNGVAYTFQAGAPTSYGQVQVGADDTESAVNLAAAINLYEASIGSGAPEVGATSALAVVTVTATAEGTAANAYTLAGGDGTVVASAATLGGGTATGGVQSTGATDQLILFWLNKK